jgi:uracil-DNA glycosylase
MIAPLPASIRAALALADPSWIPILERGLQALSVADPTYLPALAEDSFFPTESRMFAAFSLPIEAVRCVLVGEGPYPRAASATGVCFMDGAVGRLWSAGGLSREVNRATSLRNFIKMLLVAQGDAHPEHTSGAAMVAVAERAQRRDSAFVQTLAELQFNLTRHGVLLLNAALVFRQHVAPQKEARAWRPFLVVVMEALASRPVAPDLVLWGKVAAQLQAIEASARLRSVVSEHPYNLSFIRNKSMQDLFGPMKLLLRPDA